MITDDKITALAAKLDSSAEASLNPDGIAVYRQLILLLAEGRPVSPERLASIFERSPDEVIELLRKRRSLEWDEAGSIVGAGLTLRPTPHRFMLNGQSLFTWCALDSLMLPALIGQTIHVESPCASTGQLVSVTVGPEGVKSCQPPGAVVSVVTPQASTDFRRVFCDYVNFFLSAEAAAGWLTEHPGAVILSVAEAFQLGRRLTQSVFRHWSGPDHPALDITLSLPEPNYGNSSLNCYASWEGHESDERIKSVQTTCSGIDGGKTDRDHPR